MIDERHAAAMSRRTVPRKTAPSRCLGSRRRMGSVNGAERLISAVSPIQPGSES